MRMILSLAVLLIVVTTYYTGLVPVSSFLVGSVLLALVIIRLIFWGKAGTLPAIGQVIYFGTTKVTVIAVFDSFFSIPESIKLLQSDALIRDADMQMPFIVGIARSGKCILSPYYSLHPTYPNEKDLISTATDKL